MASSQQKSPPMTGWVGTVAPPLCGSSPLRGSPRVGPRRSRAPVVMRRDPDAVRIPGRVRRPGRGRGGDRDPNAAVQPTRDHERPPGRLAGGGRAFRPTGTTPQVAVLGV